MASIISSFHITMLRSQNNCQQSALESRQPSWRAELCKKVSTWRLLCPMVPSRVEWRGETDNWAVGNHASWLLSKHGIFLCSAGHSARMPDETDARSIITAYPSKNWRRQPGRPRTTLMKTIQQDLRFNNLSLDEAITVAQNRPLWRLMSVFGATHP